MAACAASRRRPLMACGSAVNLTLSHFPPRGTFMKACLVYGSKDLRIEDIADLEPSAGEVKVEIAFAGLCGSDLHLLEDPEHSGFHIKYRSDGSMVPLRLGHEYSGTVTALGENVGDISVGDRVAVYPIGFCGRCEWCANGLASLCTAQTPANNGGVGQSVVVPARQVFVLPPDVDLELGALVEPMAVAWHSLRHLSLRDDSTVLVSGAGPIGVGIYLSLRARGFTNVLVSEPNAERRARIEQLGAHAIDPLANDLDAAVSTLSEGRGVDAAIDAAGTGHVLRSAISALRPRGVLVVVAIHTTNVSFDPWALQLQEKSLVGSFAHQPEDFQEVIAAMAAGHFPTEGWVAKRPMAEVAEAFVELSAGQRTKVLLENTWS